MAVASLHEQAARFIRAVEHSVRAAGTSLLLREMYRRTYD